MATLTAEKLQGWSPASTFVPADQAAPQALALNPLVASSVPAPQGDQTFVRVPFVGADPTAQVVREGEEIPLDDSTRAEAHVYSQKVGLLMQVSREAYGQQLAGDANNLTANASDLFTESLRRAVTSKLDHLFCTYADTDPESPYAPGIAVDRTAAVIDAGSITDNLDPLTDALAAVADNGAAPTCILTSNSGWARLQKLKYSDNRPIVNPNAQEGALPQLAGLPVVRSAAMPKDTLMILDATNIISTVNDVQVDVDSSMFFSRDAVAVRVIGRIGWAVIQRGRLARLTIGQPDTGKDANARRTGRTAATL